MTSPAGAVPVIHTPRRTRPRLAADRRNTDYWPPTLGGERIDWILTSPDVETIATAVNTYRWRGQYPSDHLPVQALLRLPAPSR